MNRLEIKVVKGSQSYNDLVRDQKVRQPSTVTLQTPTHVFTGYAMVVSSISEPDSEGIVTVIFRSYETKRS